MSDSNEDSRPVIFTVRKLKPDVRLFVFDREYHVYSGALKLHSEFFEKFLEPSGGVMPVSSSHSFKSDWHTDIEEDGSWHLSSDSSVCQKDQALFVGNKTQEQDAFNNILCAIFSRPYTIKSALELRTMVGQADYYCVLPAISNSISNAVPNSPGLLSDIQHKPCLVLESAYKLRHQLLFRDSFIFCLGPWTNPRFTDIQIPALRTLVGVAHFDMKDEVQGFWAMIPQLMVRYPEVDRNIHSQFNVLIFEMLKGIGPTINFSGNAVMPMFLRTILNRSTSSAAFSLEQRNYLNNILSPLLRNCLHFRPDAQAGVGGFEDFFLFSSLQDQQLPWDTTQEDW